MKMLINSVPLDAAFRAEKYLFPRKRCTQSSPALTNTALWNGNEIDQSDQSPQISITQRRGLDKLILSELFASRRASIIRQ